MSLLDTSIAVKVFRKVIAITLGLVVLYVGRPSGGKSARTGDVVIACQEKGFTIMRTIRLHTLTLGAMAFVTVVGIAGAQSDVARSADLLPSQQMRELSSTPVASPEPQDEPAEKERPATRVTVSGAGFQPAKVRVKAGLPVRLTFVRTTDETCATEVVFPSLKIRSPLPLNKPVVIEFTPKKAGEIAFACGMDMFKGAVVVE